MSVKIMSMVFERYPNGGGEMMLALALADHSSDDGTKIFPSIKTLAEKTRQSERTVQYQLRRMETSGWLILVNSGNGGRNRTREYRINPTWIKGADIAPVQSTAEKGASDSIKGCKPQQERVQPVAPAYNRHRTTNEPSNNNNRAREPEKPKNITTVDLQSEGVDEQVAIEFLALRKRKRAALTPLALEGIRREAGRADITLGDALLVCIERGWQSFRAEWVAEQTAGPPGATSTGNRRDRYAKDAEQIQAMARWADEQLRQGNIDAQFPRIEG